MTLDCKHLHEEIQSAFGDIMGPPKITLAEARGLDDYHPCLTELQATQSHHRRWQDVTDTEIEAFQDVFAYMDNDSVHFYIPAYMSKHLRDSMAAGAPVDPPPWTAYVFYDDSQIEARVKLFTKHQRDCVLWFLHILLRGAGHPDTQKTFIEKTLTPWVTALKSLD